MEINLFSGRRRHNLAVTEAAQGCGKILLIIGHRGFERLPVLIAAEFNHVNKWILLCLKVSDVPVDAEKGRLIGHECPPYKAHQQVVIQRTINVLQGPDHCMGRMEPAVR